MENPPPPQQQPQLPAEELLKKSQELEAGQAHLKEAMSKLVISSNQQSERRRSHSISPQRQRSASAVAPRRAGGGDRGTAAAAWKKGSASFRHSWQLQRESGGGGPAAVKFTDKQYSNILQSMGQSVHIFDLNGHIIYWNRTAERLYGYSATEALGKDAIELLTDARHFAMANDIVHRVAMGESWTGQFPVEDKRGDRFLAVATLTPFYDDDGPLGGVICVSSDSRPFHEMRGTSSSAKHSEGGSSFTRPRSIASAKLGLDRQQPLKAAIASKILNLASKVSNKVKSKIKTGENSMEHKSGTEDSRCADDGLLNVTFPDQNEDAALSVAYTAKGDTIPPSFGVFSQVAQVEHSVGKTLGDSDIECGREPVISKIITSKEDTWIGKKGLSWPGKGNEREGSVAQAARFFWPWLHSDQENNTGLYVSSHSSAKAEIQVGEANRTVNSEAQASSSFNVTAQAVQAVVAVVEALAEVLLIRWTWILIAWIMKSRGKT